MMSAPSPAQDPVTKEALLVHRSYVRLRGVDTVDGLDILRAILEHLSASGDISRCAAEDATPGFLSLKLELEPTAHQVHVAAGGTLPSLAVGRCLLAALDRAIAANPVPPNASSATAFQSIEMPPG